MPQPYDYGGLMAQSARLTDIYPGIQEALLGQQKIKSNDMNLQQQQQSMTTQAQEQARADHARAAYAQIAQNPQLDDTQFEQLLGPIAQADPNAAMQLRRTRAMQAAAASVMANPTAQNVGRFGMAYPEAFKDMKEAYGTLDGAAHEAALKANVDVAHLLDSGSEKEAIDYLQQHMAVAQQTGEDVSSYPQLIDLIRTNPKAARTFAWGGVLSALGPEKFADNFGKISEPARGKAAAEASTAETEAQYAAPKAESDLQTAAAQRQRMAAQTANEQADLVLKRQGLELDRDKLTSTIQLELEKLDAQGTQLDAGARQAVNTSVGNSAAASALADRMGSLADQMEGSGQSSGWKAAFYEKAKGVFGAQDSVSGLRAQYNQIVNAQAVKNLPPGPASDKDIALAKQGFPPDSASPAYLSSFLRGLAKMQQAVAAAEDRKANWIAATGSLAPVRRDVNIGGVMVPAGTTFTEFNGNAVKRNKQDAIPDSLSGIMQKYGQ